mmetsp:Transcript_1282/g.2079  ORF Transcript_1282/g.2079 Transcript_1282/m.2079 type:complete len:295 (+) Transcript_1282:102-986(+)
MDSIAPLLLWPAIISLPLILTSNDLYISVFPAEWYDTEAHDFWYDSKGIRPSPVGLTLGILAVVVGQAFVLAYFYAWKLGWMGGKLKPIQKVGAPQYVVYDGMIEHLSQPEGFVMLGGYLILTWMLGLMPASYYSFSGGINWYHVAAQLLIQDAIQFLMHNIEHTLDKRLYQASHKPHHRFTNPKMFDAFNGSPADTFLMILVPLLLTARLVNANVWSYMTFGSLYANWLTMIHSEYVHPWDKYFRFLGFGTAADHHVHHKLFVYNFGHLFMYWDWIFGTYKDPTKVSVFNEGV